MRLAILRGLGHVEVRVHETRGDNHFSFSQRMCREQMFNSALTERQLCARTAWSMRKQVRKFAAALAGD